MLFAFIASYLGFAALALKKNRHLHQLWPGLELPATLGRALTACGWSLLAAAAIYLVWKSGIGNGLVEYFAVLTAAGLTLALQFSYAPHSVAGLGIINRIRRNPSIGPT